MELRSSLRCRQERRMGNKRATTALRRPAPAGMGSDAQPQRYPPYHMRSARILPTVLSSSRSTQTRELHVQPYAMMRQSMAPLRQSHVPGQPQNAAAIAKLAEKKKEFEAVAALERASAKFLKRVEDLGDDFEVMADAGTGQPILKCSPGQQELTWFQFAVMCSSNGQICSEF